MVSVIRPKEDLTAGYSPERGPQSTPVDKKAEQSATVDVPQTREGAEIALHKPQGHDSTVDSTIDSMRSKLRRTRRPVQVPQIRDALTRNVEQVMSEGLDDAFRELTPIQQQEFKIKGEETAQAIRQLLSKTKIKIREIFKLIFAWLHLLPGVNKYFLEQEAKIKAEKIIALRHFDETKKK